MDSAGHVLPRDPIWMSSDPTVATVGGGRIAAKAAGTATITAQFEAKAATSEIKVVGIAPLPTPTGPTGPTEDCLAYNPASISIAHDKALGWQVVDGQKVIASLDRESEAQQALILARRYKSHCFLGRSNTRPNHNDFIIDYWLTPTNNPGGIPDEDCTEYDSATLAFGDMGASGFGVRDNRRQVTLADTKADAEKAWTIAKAHRALCTIGRRNKRPNQRDYMVQYWR
jgi:hypothetical protein